MKKIHQLMLNMKIQNNIISLLKTVNFNELKDYDYHILILAIENNCIDVVNYLIANNINVNYFNETVLMIANRNHHIRIVKIINQVNRLKDKNLLNSKKIINKIISILIDKKLGLSK